MAFVEGSTAAAAAAAAAVVAAPAGADAVRRESFNKCYTCLDGEGGTTARGVATTP